MRAGGLYIFVGLVGATAVGCLAKFGGGGSGGAGGSGGGGSAGVGGGGATSISCATPGATRACCGDGVQSCGRDEFPTWGPCISPTGTTLTCCLPEELSSCDGGVPGDMVLPPPPPLCTAGGANNEPGILVGYAPANNQSVGVGGQIKVWVNDEGAPIIAPNEQVNATTGMITTPGDRTAKAADGYLWEPALYIAPQSAENGGTPHFPTAIKGDYNNTTIKGPGTHVPGMDPAPPGSMPLQQQYTAEFIWDVSSLGLAPGNYLAEFVIHDGDRDRGVGCVAITISTVTRAR
jgi:hypothetical protein